MMNDRDQKQKALRLSVANRWFPQLEVDVNPGREVSRKLMAVTDLDVFSSIPDEFKGYRFVVFDCKTLARESPINRSLWVAGIMQRVRADQGFCVLKKESITPDHCLMASSLNVILIAEKDFDLYARATSPRYNLPTGNIGNIENWENLFRLPARFPKLEAALLFCRSRYWMIEDSADACRRTIALLRLISPELDPARHEHVTIFFEFCAIFAHSLSVVICRLFKTFLQPSSQEFLSEALLLMLYGGRDNYRHRSEIQKMLKEGSTEQDSNALSLPEWERLLHLVRQLLDAPMEVQKTPLILRESGFSVLSGDTDRLFAKILCAETPQGSRFALLIANYLSKASKLPPEFGKKSDEILISLLAVA